MRRLGYLVTIVMLASACGAPAPAVPTAPSTPSPPGTPAGPSAPPAPAAPPAWDVEAQGVPQFVTHNYIDLTNITRISRFRSGEGHDYSDNVEQCRSMKHYFVPGFTAIDASTIPIYSPVTGRVVRVRQEWAGVQIEIESTDQPAFRVILFHVNATIPLSDGTMLGAGQRIGTHIGSQTSSDVAIAVDSTQGLRFVSWFDAITDALLATYTARGVPSRAAAVITRAERDGSPLSCNGESFASPGSLNNWLMLR